MIIRTSSLDELKQVTSALRELIDQGYLLYLFSGDLGAGKTTLIQTICRSLGVEEPVSSPTFSLINAYESALAGTVYHMDLYRLESVEQIVQLGLEEYLDSGKICLIEWPEIGMSYFYPPYVRVVIETEPHNIRNFIITTYDTMDA